jgi:hypothetical protein
MPGLKRQPILWVRYVFRAFRLDLVAYLQYEAFKSLLAKWLNFHFGPEQSYTNRLHRKRQLRFIMQHTVDNLGTRPKMIETVLRTEIDRLSPD